ncbi:uncharacterized protein LOC126656938 [Mercurialis annua]|uniref:uncharacterized protein LOC126656938 n=1 Tax=Mercurialis annua TaxID=3986 RepID=UPI00215EEAAB|nr:uncharacterized protein LOC126656938 [Mercurialis annua]
MSVWERNRFHNDYGWVAHLIYIQVLPTMLKAMLKFWDPTYNCFTFGKFDLCPTIEEYQEILNLGDSPKIYFHHANEIPRRQLDRSLNVKNSSIGHWQIPDSKNFSADAIIKFYHETDDVEQKRSAFAILIYGLIIFPTAPGVINERVGMFVRSLKGGVHPVTAILAETIRSLSSSQSLGFLRPQYSPAYNNSKGYPLEFIMQEWPERSPLKKVWVRFFTNLSEENIEWLCPRKNNQKIIHACGEFPWIPLAGIWGITAYVPNMFRRQYGNMQFIPWTFGLSRMTVSYNDPNAGSIL